MSKWTTAVLRRVVPVPGGDRGDAELIVYLHADGRGQWPMGSINYRHPSGAFFCVVAIGWSDDTTADVQAEVESRWAAILAGDLPVTWVRRTGDQRDVLLLPTLDEIEAGKHEGAANEPA